jgi:hypothetical protein
MSVPAERFLAQAKAARRTGCPLLAVATPDASVSVARLQSAFSAIAALAQAPAFEWDCMRGLRAINLPGEAAFPAMLGGLDPSATTNATSMLQEVAPKLPADGVLYCHNMHRYLNERGAEASAFLQAIWNLRDPFKADTRMLVLFGPAITLPPELQQDALALDEPLPDDAELETIVRRVMGDNEVPAAGVKLPEAVAALRGLAAFPAEQAVAMACNRRGVAVDELWRRKEQFISQTPGLAVWQGGVTFADVVGYPQVKRGITLHAEGTDPFEAVLWWDEVEKMFAGATEGTSDMSGVSQGMLGPLLTKMQEWIEVGGAVGMLFVGGPGTGKSAVAKAAGATFGKPTIAVDAGAAKNSLVGESERQMRQMLKVVDAVTGGRVLIIMTCNKQVALPPELKRRLTGGVYYFDLPEPAEQDAIWQYYEGKFKVSGPRPRAEDWTGAEIRTACALASTTKLPLVETADFIVPVAQSAREQIEALRQQADGRFLSASYPGKYLRNRAAMTAAPTPTKRRIAAEA